MTLTEEEAYKKFLKAEYEEHAEERYITVSDGSQIRVLLSKAPKKEHNGYTLVFVAGWNTVVPGWDETLLEAMKDFDIVYIETREKGSSIVDKKAKFDMDRFSSDIQDVIEELQINQKKMIIFSSSLGTIVTAHLLGSKKLEPFLAYFVGPVHRFETPRGSRYYMYLVPNCFLTVTRPIWKLWIRRRKSEDPEQAAKYIRALEEAEVKKWRATAYANAWDDFLDMYEKIEVRNYIVGMEKDKMHEREISKRIHESMKNSTYIDLETNKKTHSSEMIKVIRQHLSDIKKEK
jgi:pimeloyl-ACP methyl ester carboxylesterase